MKTLPLFLFASLVSLHADAPVSFVRDVMPILNKAGQFAASPQVRVILGQLDPRLDLSFAMNNGRILIANLAKGTFTAYTVTADEAGFHSCRKLEFVDGKLVSDTIVPFPKGPK